jgi:nucleotidyltransferase/DNA polymerase involved in DNA repair
VAKLDPLPYATAERMKRPALPLVSLVVGAIAVLLVAACNLAARGYGWQFQMSTLGVVLPAAGMSSLGLNVIALATSAVAIMRRRGPLQILAGLVALLYWAVGAAAAYFLFP